MARPIKNNVSSGNQGWDGAMDDNFEVWFEGPAPIYEHAGDQTDLEATFAAAMHDRCHVMVNHTTLGWCLYVSDGTAWQIKWILAPQALVAMSDSTSGTANDTLVAVTGSGDDTNINNNFADVAAKLNQIRTILLNSGVVS